MQSLQEKYWPQGSCFGCGPANKKGLRIQSFVEGEEIVTRWRAEPEHEAFPGVLNGGIIGSLLDCHCNWTATDHLMKKRGADHPPCTVTAEYSIKLLRPTPMDQEIILKSKVVEATDDRVTVTGTLEAGGKICATCRGVFVAVKPGHPAYHRW
ncbi:MAG: PaaI family thioesterase [Deltaproteobacteria bacterium]|nr:PaaI family thioesterase [Deltaproteobacteria bacterium]